jgi:hypothetical protein
MGLLRLLPRPQQPAIHVGEEGVIVHRRRLRWDEIAAVVCQANVGETSVFVRLKDGSEVELDALVGPHVSKLAHSAARALSLNCEARAIPVLTR